MEKRYKYPLGLCVVLGLFGNINNFKLSFR